MANGNVYVNRMTFEGGVNNTLTDELIADNEMASCDGYVPNPSGNGNIVKRYGYTQHLAGTAAKIVTAIFSGKLNRYFSTYDSGTAADFCIYDLDNGAELYTHTDPNDEVYFGSLNGVDYLSCGSLELKTTDGTNWVTWSGPFADSALASPTILATYNNMLWGMSRSQPIKVGWSAVSDGDTWSATQTYELDAGSTTSNYNLGSALVPFRDRLIIFGQESMFAIQAFGATDATVVYSRNDIGCIGPRAAVASPYGLIWWSGSSGIVRSVDGYQIDTPMLRKLLGTFNTVRQYQGYLIEAVYRPDLGCVRFFVPSAVAARMDMRIDYYPLQDAFYVHTLGFGTTSQRGSCVTIDNTFSAAGVNEYVGYGIKVLKEGSTIQELGSTTTATLKTKRYSQGSVAAVKTSRNVFLTTKMASAGTVTYGYSQDNATSLSQSFTPTIATGVVDTNIGINNTNRKIQHYISDANNARNEIITLTEVGMATEIT